MSVRVWAEHAPDTQNEWVTHGIEKATHGAEKATHGIEKATHGAEKATHGAEWATQRIEWPVGGLDGVGVFASLCEVVFADRECCTNVDFWNDMNIKDIAALEDEIQNVPVKDDFAHYLKNVSALNPR